MKADWFDKNGRFIKYIHIRICIFKYYFLIESCGLWLRTGPIENSWRNRETSTHDKIYPNNFLLCFVRGGNETYYFIRRCHPLSNSTFSLKRSEREPFAVHCCPCGRSKIGHSSVFPRNTCTKGHKNRFPVLQCWNSNLISILFHISREGEAMTDL